MNHSNETDSSGPVACCWAVERPRLLLYCGKVARPKSESQELTVGANE